MSEQPFSNEVALRIGLAARCLSGVSVSDLIEAIQLKVGETIDEEGLSRVTVAHLKTVFGQAAATLRATEKEQGETMAPFKEAVRILWGGAAGAGLPAIEADDGAETSGAVRVAFASNSGEELNGHFGSCARFLIYRVTATELKLVDIRETSGALIADDKNVFRVGLIEDCKILYVVHAGGPAAAKVIKADIHLISVPNGGNPRTLLEQLQRVLAGSPPPWLAKAMGLAPRVLTVSYGAPA